jgi:enolase-like protein
LAAITNRGGLGAYPSSPAQRRRVGARGRRPRFDAKSPFTTTLAEAHNLPVTSHGAHDLTVHLMAAAPNRTYMEAHGFGLERYLHAPLQILDGAAIAPERPGHGLTFDFDALAPHRIGGSRS